MLTQYENAKLQEAVDVPLISILDPATPPDYKDSPSRAKITLLGGFIGGFFSLCYYAWPDLKRQMMKNHRALTYNEDEEIGPAPVPCIMIDAKGVFHLP